MIKGRCIRLFIDQDEEATKDNTFKICPKCNINARSNHEVQDQIITSIREDLTANQIDLLSYQKNPRIMPSSLRKLFGSGTLDLKLIKMICSVSIIYEKSFWSRGLVKSRLKNWQ